MKLSKEQVQKIANLARLELSPDELDKSVTQLSAILDYVEKLNELDVSKIEPTAHAMMVPTPFREDQVVQSDVLEDALKNAPDREDDFFKVPKVIG